MTIDEYLLAFESILYGLMVSRIIVQWNKILQNSKQYQHYWAFYMPTITVFLLIVYVYSQNWNPERYELMKRILNFLLLGVIPPTIFSFISYQLFPHAGNVNLKTFLMESRRKVLAPMIIFFSFFTGYIFIINGWTMEVILGMFLLLLAIAVFFYRKYWVLEVFTVSLFVFTLWLYLGYYILESV